MKSYAIVCSFLSQIFFCQTSDSENCSEILKKYYHSYDKKIELSSNRDQISLKDTVNLYHYNGIVGQFDNKSKLFAKHENARILPADNSCIKVIVPTWTVEKLFNKKGILRKKQSIYKYSTYGVNQLFFPLDKNKKPFKINNIGDPLFKLKLDDFINILDRNGINKNTVKNFIGNAATIYKYITPYGKYWEYYVKTNENYLLVLVSDKTGEIIVKSFDTDPNYCSKWAEYLNKRKEIFQNDATYRLKESDLQYIFKEYVGINDSTNYTLMKYEGLNSVEYFQQYISKTWLIKSNYNNNRIKPVLMLIDDKTGQILIDINSYPRNIDGEEQFIKDFNELMIRIQKE